jgi:hypothetical protein
MPAYASSEYYLDRILGHFDIHLTGEMAGSTSAVRCPPIKSTLVKIKAAHNNAGIVYLGGVGVTKADGSSDSTTGFPLGPGEESPWYQVDNLNRIYRICDNAGDDSFYIVLHKD